MRMTRKNENEDWCVEFDDGNVRYFDKRFTKSQAWTKAQRYWSGDDHYIDGFYKEATA